MPVDRSTTDSRKYPMKHLNRLASHAHWLLRLGLASVFFFHGVLKFLDLEGFTAMLPISYTEVVLVALAEVGGSLLLVLGGFRDDFWSDLATRVGALKRGIESSRKRQRRSLASSPSMLRFNSRCHRLMVKPNTCCGDGNGSTSCRTVEKP